eukprot:GHVS01084888.1.p1 GENE.GHVS01084888.1~~GHVS01084888.1.p1  ORF type:complete len:173 (-),score=13.30 GHVS01084888.1:953-1471(-)
MWSFVGMPTGKIVVLLVAAAAAMCISVARAEFVSYSSYLKNNVYGTLLTASKDWTPEMLTEFRIAMDEFDNNVFAITHPIASTQTKTLAICQMQLLKKHEDRKASHAETDHVIAQTEFFTSDWVAKAKAVNGGSDGDAWTITNVETEKKAAKYIPKVMAAHLCVRLLYMSAP